MNSDLEELNKINCVRHVDIISFAQEGDSCEGGLLMILESGDISKESWIVDSISSFHIIVIDLTI